MTTEQKEAIDRLNYINRAYDYNNYYSTYDLDCIDVVLNLIQEQEKEIEKYKKLYQKALDDAVVTAHDNMQRDKIIDLMAKQLAGLTIFDIDKEEPLILGDKEKVKQFFERKVEDERN